MQNEEFFNTFLFMQGKRLWSKCGKVVFCVRSRYLPCFLFMQGDWLWEKTKNRFFSSKEVPICFFLRKNHSLYKWTTRGKMNPFGFKKWWTWKCVSTPPITTVEKKRLNSKIRCFTCRETRILCSVNNIELTRVKQNWQH